MGKRSWPWDRRGRLRRLALATCVGVGAIVADADAHRSAGAVRIEHRTKIDIGRHWITVEHRLQSNRPAAYLESLAMDRDQDGDLSVAEMERYIDQQRRRVMAALELRLDGTESPLEPHGQVQLEMPFRKTWRFRVAQPHGWRRGVTLIFHDDGLLDVDGDVRIDITAAAGVVVDVRRTDHQSLGEWQTRDVRVRYHASDLPRGAIAGSEPASGDGAADATVSDGTDAVAAAAVLFLTGALAVVRWRRTGRYREAVVAAIVAAGLVIVWQRQREFDPVVAVATFRRLHDGVYLAATARSEEDLYATLAASLEGRLLDRVYDRMYEAMTRAQLGLADARVRRIERLSSEVRGDRAVAGRGSFRMRHRWRVYALVSHHGHRHSRVVDYEAVFTVRQVGAAGGDEDDGWRIVEARLAGMWRADAS